MSVLRSVDPKPARRQPAIVLLALPALAAATTAILTLHVLQPELDPWHEPVSFYVHGRHGWLLPFALATFGAAAVALALGIHHAMPTHRPRRALVGFGVGMWVTAVLPSDRWFPWEQAPSFSGLVHSTLAVIAPVILLDPMLTLARRGGSAQSLAARVFAAGYIVGLLGSGASLLWGFMAGGAPPLIGVAERVLAASALGWLIVVAFHVAREARRTGP